MTMKDEFAKFDKMMNAVKAATSAKWFEAFCDRFGFCTFAEADGQYWMSDEIRQLQPEFVNFDEWDGDVYECPMFHFNEAIAVLRESADVREELCEKARA